MKHSLSLGGCCESRCISFKGEPLEILEYPVPQPGPGQVRVRIRACGICGSDIHALDSDWLQSGVVMGHEFSGEIAALGANVNGWEIGQRVAPLSQISCGKCEPCANGYYSDCLNIEYLDYNPKHNGGYSEYVVVGENDLLPLPDSVSFAEAASLEPLAVGLDAVRHAEIKAGDNVLIIGAGPIGLCIAQWVRYFGAKNVVVSELTRPDKCLPLKWGQTLFLTVKQSLT